MNGIRPCYRAYKSAARAFSSKPPKDLPRPDTPQTPGNTHKERVFRDRKFELGFVATSLTASLFLLYAGKKNDPRNKAKE